MTKLKRRREEAEKSKEKEDYPRTLEKFTSSMLDRRVIHGFQEGRNVHEDKNEGGKSADIYIVLRERM